MVEGAAPAASVNVDGERERQEAQRKANEERERREAEEAQRAEQERLAEQERQAEQKRQERERREAEEAQRAEQERLAEQERQAEQKRQERERREAEEAQRVAAEVQADVTDSTDDDRGEHGYDELEYLNATATGKVSLQTYVPSSIAAKVKEMQQTGRSAEKIVLTAVAQCANRLPEIIAEARGPVHEGGLFPGLEIIERGPGRPKKVEPANTRLQYSVSGRWMPTLQETARRYNLRQSVLARLALGDYFGIPVRIERVL
ncbi:hypothetical protein ACQPYK_49400 (plasmid) [Streptosporangium sp. CA-135522]|uniref:hypothetical protein n=1 Tax=Streptosporangium sp. CA-135522 TaxID=3240072 RepID=UPI003D8E8B92